MQRWCLVVLIAVVVSTGAFAQAQFTLSSEASITGGREFKGLVSATTDRKAASKRAVIRIPEKWNGSLVIGAHGGGGGNNFDRAGLSLTYQFADLARAEVTRRLKGTPLRMYIVGLSAGGGIARMAAESMPTPFDGALIIAGAGGDVVTRLDRQTRVAALWPLIDPQSNYRLSAKDPKIVA